MGEALDRLSVKLAAVNHDLIMLTRVWVPAYARERNGQIEQVDGYWRVIKRLSDLTPDEVASMLRHSVVKFKGKLPEGAKPLSSVGTAMHEHVRGEYGLRRSLDESKAATSKVIRTAPTLEEQRLVLPGEGGIEGYYQPHGSTKSPLRNVMRMGLLQGLRLFQGSRRS